MHICCHIQLKILSAYNFLTKMTKAGSHSQNSFNQRHSFIESLKILDHAQPSPHRHKKTFNERVTLVEIVLTMRPG
jgi:hypothetical protein